MVRGKAVGHAQWVAVCESSDKTKNQSSAALPGSLKSTIIFSIFLNPVSLLFPPPEERLASLSLSRSTPAPEKLLDPWGTLPASTQRERHKVKKSAHLSTSGGAPV